MLVRMKREAKPAEGKTEGEVKKENCPAYEPFLSLSKIKIELGANKNMQTQLHTLLLHQSAQSGLLGFAF